MAIEETHPKLIPPPVSDEWKPNHKKHKKSHGLIVFTKPWNFYHWIRGELVRTKNTNLSECVYWYATERDRDNAIARMNKMMYDTYGAPLALAKVER
jgi:biotin carboxylase